MEYSRGTFIDVGAVKRHLDAGGHKNVTTTEATRILQQLGFLVKSEENECGLDIQAEQKSTHCAVSNRPRDRQQMVPSSMIKDAHGLSHVRPPSIQRPTFNNSNRKAQKNSTFYKCTALAARLEKLEEQLQRLAATVEEEEEEEALSIADSTHETEYCGSDRAPSFANIPTLCPLGNEAEQLQDWLAGRWPNLCQSLADCCEQREETRREKASPASLCRRRRRSDPVVRHQQLQKIWAKDPFLRNTGDERLSRRKQMGFREAFASLHARSSLQ